MPLIALACLSGALFAFYGNRLPDPLWFAYWPLLLWAAACLKRYRFILTVASSYLLFGLSFHLSLMDRLPEALHDQTLIIQGRVNSLVTQRTGRLSFLFAPELNDKHNLPLPELIRLNWYQDSVIPEPGSTWLFDVKLRPPRGQLNPGGFDYQKWLLVSGIGATGYIRDNRVNREIKAPAAWTMNAIRQRLVDQLEQACARCETSGLIIGLVTGHRGNITSHHQALLKHTGTAHLLAISGLHIGMVSLLFYWAGYFAWNLCLWRAGLARVTVSAICGLFGAILFSALAGFSLPTLRALLFVVIVLLSWLLRKQVNLLHCISIAVIVILVVDPLAIGSASFWLTLSALMVIAISLPWIQHAKSRLAQFFLLQVSFALCLALPGLILIGQASFASLPANLMAVPIVSFLVLPLVFIAGMLLILGIPMLPAWLLSIADRLLSGLLSALDQFVIRGLTTLDRGDLPLWLIVSVLTALLIWWLPFPTPLRKLTSVLLLVWVQWRPVALMPGEFRITVLDSGLGNAIVVETRTHSLIYDFGPGFEAGYSTLDQVIKPYLGQGGLERLNMMIISHVDHDHSGGFHALQPGDIHALLLSGTAAAVSERFNLPGKPRSCHDYRGWRWDNVDFEFLDGQADQFQSTNNRSCVLLISGIHKAILPGDIEEKREQGLVTQYDSDLQADLLVTPHHGSKTSSSMPFVSHVAPEIVVHTQSQGNRWGFPHSPVVARYQSIGARQLSSGSHGAIIFTSRENGFEVDFTRQAGQRIWR